MVKSQFTSEDQKDANIFSDQEHDAQEREQAEKQAKLDAIEQEELAKKYVLELQEYYRLNTQYGKSKVDLVEQNKTVKDNTHA